MASGATTVLAVPLIAEAMTKIFFAGINDAEKVDKLKSWLTSNSLIKYFGMNKVKSEVDVAQEPCFPKHEIRGMWGSSFGFGNCTYPRCL